MQEAAVPDPYRAPSAPPPVIHPDRFALYAPPAWKVMVLSVMTLGWYDIYWFYRNWTVLGRISGQRLSAPWRSMLYVVWMGPCLTRMRALVQGAGQPWRGHPWGLSVLYALLGVGTYVAVIAAPLLVPLGALVLVLVSRQARRYNTAMGLEAPLQARFGPWHVLVCLLGAVVWLGVFAVLLQTLLWLLQHQLWSVKGS